MKLLVPRKKVREKDREEEKRRMGWWAANWPSSLKGRPGLAANHFGS